jgi:hypothetical protein
MSEKLKQEIAECYRRAEQYRQLYHRCSNLDQREKCFLATMQLTRIADDLKKRLREKHGDEFEVQVSRR